MEEERKKKGGWRWDGEEEVNKKEAGRNCEREEWEMRLRKRRTLE